MFVATCLAAAVTTLVMALYANYPIALAPGMGLNAFFAFTVVLAYKYTWQQALAVVFTAMRLELDLLQLHRLVVRPYWLGFLAAGVLAYAVLRTLRKTGVLHVHGR